MKSEKIINLCGENKFKYLPLIYILSLFFIILLSHQNWFFSFDPITSGDWWYHHTESMIEWFSMPYAWDTQNNLGIYPITSLSFYGFNVLYGFFAFFEIPLSLSERILFFWPVAILSIVGMYYLSQKIFNNHLISFFASMIYSLNTYFLLLQTGHLTVAMSYSLTPFIIAFFIDSIKKVSMNSAVITGLLLSISFVYEPRIGYIISLIMFMYILAELLFWKLTFKKTILSIFPYVITFLIHSFWLIPYILGASSNLEVILPSNPWISWMGILDSVSLHHPFWTGETPTSFIVHSVPVYFFVIPLLAFFSLLVRNKKYEHFITFFALIGLIGIFLVKQENPPFGDIYSWLFHNFPGFNMFREASKFYLLTALSYSVLAGFTINELYRKLSCIHSKASAIKYIFIAVVFILIIFQAKPAFTNELGGSFDTTTVPSEYIDLKDYFHNQDDYFRTLWYPTKQRFGYYSNNHPMISGTEMFFREGPLGIFVPPNSTEMSLPENQTFYNLVDTLSIKYIVVPFDSEDDIYKYYSPKDEFIKDLDEFSWLKKTAFSENIMIYENDRYMDHFFGIYSHNITTLSDPANIIYFENMKKTNLEYKMVNPTKYIVTINSSEPLTLAFSEAYDSNWIAKKDGKKIKPYPLFSTINGFELSDTGNYDLTIEYKYQTYVNKGAIISFLTLISCIGYLLLGIFKKRYYQINQ